MSGCLKSLAVFAALLALPTTAFAQASMTGVVRGRTVP